MDKYYVIKNASCGEDVQEMTREGVLKEICGYFDEWGDNLIICESLDELAEYQDHGMMIIKGEVLIPTAKEVVVEYDLK